LAVAPTEDALFGKILVVIQIFHALTPCLTPSLNHTLTNFTLDLQPPPASKMKLDVTCMRYLTKDDYRVLQAVEIGMRNHELVPVDLIGTIAKLRHGGSHKILSTLLRHKLIAHDAQKYNGYRLSYLGYDILALKSFLARGTITGVGGQIGVGKESDIFEAQDENGDEVVLKIHRLGRTSFRTVRKNRDYLGNKSKVNWLYLSRLAAVKEFAFMQALHAHDFPTPVPIDQNRHIVIMSRVAGFPMAQIKSGNMEGAEHIYHKCVGMLRRLAEHGLVHCDFNEFNIMTDQEGNLTMIDFPQMISTSHPNAAEFFLRDMNCLVKFFAMKMRYVAPDSSRYTLSDICVNSEYHMYEDVQNSKGINSKEDHNLIDFIAHTNTLSDEMVCRVKKEGAVGEEDIEEDEEDDEEEDEDDEEEDDDEEEEDDDVEQYVDVKVVAKPPSVFRADLGSLKDAITSLDTESDVAPQLVPLTGTEVSESTALGQETVEVLSNEDVNDESSTVDVEADAAQYKEYQIKQKVKRANQKQHTGPKSSRNATKQRNKYGKVDKFMRDF
jgi:RIO kinase 2